MRAPMCRQLREPKAQAFQRAQVAGKERAPATRTAALLALYYDFITSAPVGTSPEAEPDDQRQREARGGRY